MAGRKGLAPAVVLAGAMVATATGNAHAETVTWIAYDAGPGAVLLGPPDFPQPGRTCLPYDACRHAILFCGAGNVVLELGYLHMNDIMDGWRTTMSPMTTFSVDDVSATVGLEGMVLVARDNWRVRLLPGETGAVLAALPTAQTITITAPLYEVTMSVADRDREVLTNFAAACTG